MSIYWRSLTLREHDIYTKIIQLNLSPLAKIEDSIFREIVLDESIIDRMNATPPGLVPSIVEAALSVSGNLLNDKSDMYRMNSDLDQMRNAVASDPYEQFIMLICKAFPTYTPSDIEHLEYQEMLRLLVMAEQMTGFNPIVLEPQKPKSVTDALFKDKENARAIDMGAPPMGNLRQELAQRDEQDLSVKQARQIEMVNRIRERRSG